MKKQVPNIIKKLRLKKAQKIQEKIANENNLSKIGSTCDVIIDYFDYATGFYYGRSQSSSPDVDFYVLFDNEIEVVIGNIYKTKIVSYENGTFKGELI